MSLIEELEEEKKSEPCGCNLSQKVFPTLSTDEREELVDILRSGKYTAVEIANVLERRGLHVKEGTIRRFRQGRCNCEY